VCVDLHLSFVSDVHNASI